MTEPRLLSSPAVVLFSGVLVAVLWAGGLNFVWELSSAQIVHVLTTGAMGAVGASFGSLLLAVAARTAQNRFDEAEHRAKHDPLTGLLNRSELFRQLEESLIDATANDLVLGVLFLDLDRFKAINDQYGHLAGDAALREVARRVQHQIRSSDLAARFGGEEFTILMPDTGIEPAAQIAERIRQCVRRAPIRIDDQDAITVTVSAGAAALVPAPDLESLTAEGERLLGLADAAMYRAKAAGRDRVFVDRSDESV